MLINIGQEPDRLTLESDTGIPIYLQELESLQKAMEPLQDSILALATLTATANGAELTAMTEILVGMRASDTHLRARLFVLQVARTYSWEHAHKMSRRKAGEYEDPDLAKVLEEMDKKEEKNKRELEKDRKKAADGAKRAKFSGPQFSRGAQNFGGYRSPLAATYAGGRSQGANNNYGYRSAGGTRPRQADEDKKCNNCQEKGHFWRACPSRK